MPDAPSRLAVLALALATGPAAAADAPLRNGTYEVAYRLELPHVETGAGERVRVCLSGVGEAKPFPVLSPNNPLSGCPAAGLRREGGIVSFEIVCPGGNAARARALFDLRDDGFDGRIAMNMGGKNMTMTEVQHGRRIGDCEAATPASATQ